MRPSRNAMAQRTGEAERYGCNAPPAPRPRHQPSPCLSINAMVQAMVVAARSPAGSRWSTTLWRVLAQPVEPAAQPVVAQLAAQRVEQAAQRVERVELVERVDRV